MCPEHAVPSFIKPDAVWARQSSVGLPSPSDRCWLADKRDGQKRSRALMTRVVVQVVIFEAERADRRHLRDVFAGFRPVEMPSFPGENDDTSRRVGVDLVDVECLAKP